MTAELLTLSALVVAAFFTGAAVYIIVVEQPARLTLDDRALLTQWQPAYRRGTAMQGSIALLGTALGLAAWWSHNSAEALFGAAAMFLNWPYTLLVIGPTNKRLTAITPDQAGPESRQLIRRWASLHLVRCLLGATGTLAFTAAILHH